MTILCPKCGKSISSDYQFCPYCGAAVNTYNTGNNGGFNNQGNTGFPPQPDFQNRNQQTQQQNQQSGWPFPFPGQNTNQNGGGATTGQNPLGGGKVLGCIAAVASFIIPLIGIVLYFMYRRKDLAYAKRMLYIALAGVAFNLLVNVIGSKFQFSYFHNLMY